MNPSVSGQRAVAVGEMSGGTIVTGDITILVQGINALHTDYATRIKGFLFEYLGTSEHPVPFGGREESLNLLDAWLDDADEPPYLLLAATAGQGKSALLARWCQRVLPRADVAVVFIPVSIRFRTNLASVVFPAVTARLAALHGEPLAADTNTPVEVWRGMMSDYLARPLADGRRLVLVLDGLDEAADWEAGPDLFPANPSSEVRVIASARPRMGESGPGPWLVALGWDRRGLGKSMALERLTREGLKDVLLRMECPLDELGQRVDIVAELHRLSEGDPLVVRLYVDDLWERKTTAPRLMPEELQVIPPGLKGYLDQWWKHQESLWDNRKENPLEKPLVRLLLKLFAFTVGPLTQTDLLNLARMALPGLGIDGILLKAALRPLDRLVLGDGKDQGYVFGHPRMAFHFAEEYECDRAETEAILLDWGKQELEALNHGSLPPSEASAYLVQYYGAHLERTDRRVDDLLGLVSDGWRLAWEALEGSYGGFMHDVRRAWRAVAKSNESEAESGGTVTRLGGELLCALCEASVLSLASNFPPALLNTAVERGLWSANQALGYARLMVEPAQRIEVLASLASLLPEGLRQAILEAALPLARGIPDDGDRAKALASLVPHLPEELRPPALEVALAVAWTGEGEFDRLWAIEALASHLTGPLLADALSAARDIPEEFSRASALAALTPHLTDPLLEEALAAVLAIQHQEIVLHALADMAPHLTGQLLVKVHAAARGIEADRHRARFLTAVASRLPDPQRQEVLGEALAAARSIGEWWYRSEALTALSSCLSEPLRAEVLEEALAALSEVTAATHPDWNDSELSARLVDLAPHLPESLLEEALATAQSLENAYERSTALVALAPRLPEALRWSILEITLEAVRTLGEQYEYVKPGVLADLAVQLPESHREMVLEEALEAARVIGDDYHRYVALEHLAPGLTESVLRKALSEVRAIRDAGPRFRALAVMATHLPEAFAQPTLQEALEEALTAARTHGGRKDRSYALTALIPYLPKPLVATTLELVADALALACDIEDEYLLLDILESLPPHLSASLLEEALVAARTIHSKYASPKALASLAPHLAEELRLPVLEEALDGAWAIRNKETRVHMLAALVPHLPEARRRLILAEALAETREIETEFRRSEALAALGPYLSEPLLAEALAMARDFGDKLARAEALAAVAPRLSEPLLAETLAAVGGIKSEFRRSQALAALAPYLPEPLLAEALATARDIEWTEDRTKAITALAPHLSLLPTTSLYHLWSRTLPALANRKREKLLDDLRALLSVMLRLGGPQVMADIFQAIRDVGRWWP